MAPEQAQPNPPPWQSASASRGAKLLDFLVAKVVLLVSLSTILVTFLILLFVTREGLPILLGPETKGTEKTLIRPEEMDSTPPETLRDYLELNQVEFEQMDRETLSLLLEVKLEEHEERPQGRDATLNTSHWRYLIRPHQWEGYAEPAYIWQPISQIKKYNFIPLLIGSLKTSLTALLFAVPIGIGAALYVSQIAPLRIREWIKPIIELLAGIPSVVLGFFALIVLASTLQELFGYPSRLNAFVAGIALALAVIPIVFSLSEDALSSVPRDYVHAAYALGSTPWQTAYSIVLPAALPGIFAAVVLGFGRAIGETIIVLMATGNASIVSWSVLDSTRTITATIAAELAETVFGSEHYRVLFLLGTVLFAITFLANMIGGLVNRRVKRRLLGYTEPTQTQR